jgi:hypothetical protein
MPWPHLTPGKDPVPIVPEAGWASGPVWTGAENPALHWDSIPRPSSQQAVTIQTELSGTDMLNNVFKIKYNFFPPLYRLKRFEAPFEFQDYPLGPCTVWVADRWCICVLYIIFRRRMWPFVHTTLGREEADKLSSFYAERSREGNPST